MTDTMNTYDQDLLARAATVMRDPDFRQDFTVLLGRYLAGSVPELDVAGTVTRLLPAEPGVPRRMAVTVMFQRENKS